MALGARGEATIVTGDNEVQILYTNRALATAEKAMNRSILAVLQGFTDNSTRVGEVALLLRAGMESARRASSSGGRPVTIVDAYKLMDKVGFSAITTTVVEAIADVIRDRDPEDAEDDDPNE